jgi:hypothetical protein
LIASLILGGCSALHTDEAAEGTPAQRERPIEYGHFPAPDGAITLGPDHTLMDLLTAVEDVTGLTFSTDVPTRQQLQMTTVGISREVTVPAESVYVWAGGLLLQNQFFLGDLTGSEPRLVGVYGTRGNPPMFELAVEDLTSYAQHPGLVVQTTVWLEHIDVRTLGNSLRGLTSDGSGRQGVIPAGNTNSVLLSGTVRQVTELVETLQRINAEAGAQQATPES